MLQWIQKMFHSRREKRIIVHTYFLKIENKTKVTTYPKQTDVIRYWNLSPPQQPRPITAQQV